MTADGCMKTCVKAPCAVDNLLGQVIRMAQTRGGRATVATTDHEAVDRYPLTSSRENRCRVVRTAQAHHGAAQNTTLDAEIVGSTTGGRMGDS